MNFLTNLFGGLGKTAMGAGKSIMGGLGNIGSSVMNAFNPAGIAQNLGQGLGKNLGGMFSGGSQAKPATSVPRVNTPFAGTQSASPNVSPSGFSGLGSVSSMGQNSILRKYGLGGSSQAFGGGSQPQASQAPQQGNWMNQLFGNMFQGMNVPQTALGLGINAIGQMTAPKINTPDLTSLPGYQSMKNFNYQLPPGAEDMIKRNHEITKQNELRKLRDLYANARPGTDYLTDSTYIRDEANLNKALETRLMDELTQAGMNYAGSEMDRFKSLGEYETAGAMLPYGEQSQRSEDYKKGFSDIGSQFIQSGMPQQYSMEDLINYLKPKPGVGA